ncbi:MAG: copper homeostasis protein CutC [Gemmatimonadales bacterium]|nr:copper homeostasis protein CutC [Gemmatimonadales bacterium]
MVALITVEACVDSVASAVQAERGGAHRVELCDNLADAGTTPSHGVLVAAVQALTIPVFPIIRLRGGSFIYDADEIAIMTADVAHARECGVHGVVIGALTPEGDVDEAAVLAWKAAAGGLPLTFHRAWDVCRDPASALETLIRLGVQRVLSSGQRENAWDGRAQLAAGVKQAAGRISIMAGGGVDEHNAAELISATGVHEIHVRGTAPLQEAMSFNSHPVPFRKNWPEDERIRMVTDAGRIGEIVGRVNGER